MLTNQVLWWLEKLWEVELCCVEIEGEAGGCLLQKNMDKEEVEMKEGERRVKRQIIN